MNRVIAFIEEKYFYLIYVYALSCCVSISLSTIILSIFLLMWFLRIKTNFNRSPKDFLLFVFFYVWELLTLAFNGIFSQFGRIINIWDKTPYFSVSVVNIKKEHVIRFLEIIFWFNSIIIIYAILQKYFDAPVIFKPLYTSDMTRFKSYFSHPLRFAGYLSCVSIFAFSMSFFYSKKFIKFIPLLLIGVFLTGSRTYFISVIFVFMLLSFLKSKKFFWVSTFATLLFTLAVTAIFPDVRYRVAHTFDYGTLYEKTNSFELRMNYWKAGISTFMKSPIYGVGDGHLTNYLKPYKEQGLIDNVAHAHNSYITIAAESGIIGLAIYVFLLFHFSKKYFKSAFGTDKFMAAFALSLFGSFINLIIGGIFESNFSTFIIWSFMTFNMGLFESLRRGYSA